ncbi:MAG: alanine--tRNA ligase [Mycobacteriales bacterium]
MRSQEIRDRFTTFFADRGHTVVPSASVIAADPTLLLVNAGMVPFKPFLLGDVAPSYPRATSIQKCIRTPDIDIVGTTTRHLTFFQMAGNFSFGDYFKDKAIPYAWELLTTSQDAGGFGFDPDRLWATVYLDDDEAAQIWTDVVGLPPERVQRRGKEDNYWSMGVPGPCGPCSEIYYDRGPAYGREGGPVADEDRYLEVWNLVFMQYVRGPGAGYDYPILGELPNKNIDTGMGIERMALVLQDVDNVYEIDLLRPLLDRASELTGVAYGAAQRSDVLLRVVAEHARTTVILIADGVVPGNEGRGYVLRRMLRRAVRSARLLGADGPVMASLVEAVRTTLGPSFPELLSDAERIERVAVREEELFLATLRTGTALFDTAAAETRQAGGATLSGERAFALHDTFGFPIDLTLEMAAEQGLSVDEDGFRRLMADQRRRAKDDSVAKKTGHVDVSAYRALLEQAGPTTFTGYDAVAGEGVVRGLLREGEPAAAAAQGDEVEVVLDRTPFYAEAGGQLPDHGRIRVDGAELEVYDVQRPLPDLVVHRARVLSGGLTSGALVAAEVDVERRGAISRAHTATHMIHRAVRHLLGESATQAGSLNDAGRLRFDFASPEAVHPAVLRDVEDEVNAVLIQDLPVTAFVTTQDEARRLGAMALFGEKYGDAVRVVDIGDYARELCGGTHASASGQLGVVKILGESSIGAGVRRVEALVGLDAFRFLAREHVLLSQLAESFKVPAEELPDRVAGVVARLREAEKELDRLRAGAVLQAAAGLAADPVDIAGVAVVTHQAPAGTSADDVRKLALDVRGRIDGGRPAVVAVAAVVKERPVLVVAVNDSARARGLSAGSLVGEVTPVLGGGGGGKADVAQGGGTKPDAIGAALDRLREAVGRAGTAG